MTQSARSEYSGWPKLAGRFYSNAKWPIQAPP
jgi:hypothetical protein